MKEFYWNFLTIMIIGFTVVIALINGNSTAEFSIMFAQTEVSTQILILTSVFIGITCGLLFMLQFVQKKGESLKAYERRLEKTSVSNDSSNAKIKVLESKIQVLEKALDDALKNK